ncbi:MAG: hypothetical protein ACFCBU_16095 [Cyanophyceae cyanobacterium]
MKRLFSRLFVSAALLLGAVSVPVPLEALEVTAEPENIVASRLEGRWEISLVISRFLGREWDGSKRATLEFISDSSVIDQIPEQYQEEIFADLTIYMAGKVIVEGKAYSFILTEVHGTPQMAAFYTEEDGSFSGVEFFHIMVALGEKRADDLLLLGDDFNGQQFLAFVRSPYSE